MPREGRDDSSDHPVKPARPRTNRAAESSGEAADSTAAVSERRHVIIMIGDGMQLAHEIAASRYLTGHDYGLSFHEFPTRVFQTTWDINVYDVWARTRIAPAFSYAAFDPTLGYDPEIGGLKPYPLLPDNDGRRDYFVTGPAARSSSAGTAMSTGMKTDSDNLAWFPGDPVNGALETSAEYLRRVYGMAIGFVTTGPITHATPGAWFSHNVSRDNYDAISEEMLTRIRPDVVIGGAGASYVDPADVETARASGEYVFVQRSEDVDGGAALIEAAVSAKQEQKKLLGLFGGPDGNFMWPVPLLSPGTPKFEPPPLEEPSFAQASIAALEVLAQNPNGLFVMLEQEDIDLANHANDFARMVGCVHDLDEAVKAVTKFVDRPGDDIDWSNTTLIVTADHANSYLRLLNRLDSGELPAQENVDGLWNYPDGSISYGTRNHTNELVAVYVRGSTANRVSSYATVYPGASDVIDNTSIYHLTLDAARR